MHLGRVVCCWHWLLMDLIEANTSLSPRISQTVARVAAVEGSVLLPLLSLFTACTLFSSILLALAGNLAVVTSLHTLKQQAYWAARSMARRDILQLDSGVGLSATSWQSVPGVDMKQTVVSGAVYTVVITAIADSVVDTVSFAWNAPTKTVTAWQDNGPSS